MMSKTLVLADDHSLLLAGLRDALQATDGLEIIGTAANGIEAISLIKRMQPDCAVLDHSMPGATGLEVMIQARRWSPDTRFVLYTGMPTPRLLAEMREAGAGGIFLKDAPSDLVCAGVQRVANGGTAIAQDVQRLLDRLGARQDLTPRELEVLHAISRGMSNAKAAEHLGISAKTIDSHRTSLMRKLDVNSVAALLVRAMRDGLIDTSGTL